MLCFDNGIILRYEILSNLQIKNGENLLHCISWKKTGTDRTGPNRTEPTRTEPNRTEPNQTEPNRIQPNRSKLSREEPNRIERAVLFGHPIQNIWCRRSWRVFLFVSAVFSWSGLRNVTVCFCIKKIVGKSCAHTPALWACTAKAALACIAEHPLSNREVVGSNPTGLIFPQLD